MGHVLCEHCSGHCCKYIALPLDKPKTKRDFEDMRWYLLHRNVTIFVEDGEWYIQFTTSCRHQLPDNRCGIYETRPTICRVYSTEECEYHAGEYEYEHLFTEPEQIEEYGRTWIRRRKERAARRKKTSVRKPKSSRRSPALRKGTR